MRNGDGVQEAKSDLAAGSIRVERSYDPRERLYVEPKSRAGRRRVPIAGALRDALVEHRHAVGDVAADALVFGEDGAPFSHDQLPIRSRAVWAAAELEPVGLHEARHTWPR